MLATLILLLPAACYLVAALGHARLGSSNFRRLALLAFLSSFVPLLLSAGDLNTAAAWLAWQPLNLLMGLLVSTLGLVVVRYAHNYLAGDPAEPRFRTWLMLCLTGVSLIVVSNHLVLLWFAWSAISISLHQLLVSYPDRFRAVLAAHKKFIFARLAEACLLGAIVLLYQQHQTLHIDTMLAHYPAASGLSASEQLAALLLAMAALFKCAQLPVHGWLIQVVEAPTPVSALLHAGVINLGGYLMILMAPLMMQAEAARWLLLVVAGLTTVLAALIMMTRISVKVRLAWSTSAQMGLMLVECALGLHELALLHLVAHSAYKAHAFLTTGSAVQAHIRARLSPSQPVPVTRWCVHLLLSGLLVAGLLAGTVQLGGPAPGMADLAAWSLVLIALSLWLPGDGAARASTFLLAPLLLIAYLVQKTAFAQLLPASPDAGSAAALWVIGLAILLLGGYAALVLPGNALSFRWRQWLFAGLYLDEWVTRTTLRIWPVRLPRAAERKDAGTRVAVTTASGDVDDQRF